MSDLLCLHTTFLAYTKEITGKSKMYTHVVCPFFSFPHVCSEIADNISTEIIRQTLEVGRTIQSGCVKCTTVKRLHHSCQMES